MVIRVLVTCVVFHAHVCAFDMYVVTFGGLHVCSFDMWLHVGSAHVRIWKSPNYRKQYIVFFLKDLKPRFVCVFY